MRLLIRLYIKEFIMAVLVVGGGLSVILSIVNLIDKLDDFMKWNAPMRDLFLYTALNIPKNLFYLLPMATLICVLFVFASAIKKNEIVAIKSVGGRIKILLVPFIIIGLILCIFAFFLSEFIMPLSLEKAEDLRIKLLSQKPSAQRLSFSEGALWLRINENSLIRIGLYSYDDLFAQDIRIILFENGTLSGQIDAEKAIWSHDTWILLNAKKYSFRKGAVERFKKLPYPELEPPKYFTERLKKTEEMGIPELYRYIRRLRQSGHTNPKLVVDFNSRLSYPFMNFFMLILGASLPLIGRIQNSLIASGIGLGISLIYWGGYILSLSLGNTGLIPPFLSPWLMPAVFAVLSINLFRRIPE